MLPGLALLAIVAVQQVEPSGLRLVESRPLSATKRWRLVEILERAK